MRASNLGDSAEALYMNLSQMPLTRAHVIIKLAKP
jgi:hypothetical protein